MNCLCCVCGKQFEGDSVLPAPEGEPLDDAYCSLKCMSEKKPITSAFLQLVLAFADRIPKREKDEQ